MKKGVDFIGVNVVFYCHDGKGNLLLNKRSKNCRDEIGCWDVGGGAMNFGESFEEAVRREIKEEYCVDAIKLNYLGVNNVIRWHKGKKTHWVAVLFAAKIDPRKTKIGDPYKMEALGWYSLDNLPDPLHSMFHAHLNFVKKAGII